MKHAALKSLLSPLPLILGSALAVAPIFISAALIPVFSSRAMADDATQHLLQFAANNTEFHNFLEKNAQSTYHALNIGCKNISQLARQLPQSLGPLTVPPSHPNPENSRLTVFPPPTHGMWKETVKLVACNKVYQINFLAVGRNPKDSRTPLLLSTLSGTTKTDPALQNLASRNGASAINRNVKDNCSQSPEARNTEFIGYMASDNKAIVPNDTGHGWFEEWEYRLCNTTHIVQMAFTPNEKGGHRINTRLKTE